jgi:diaminopimelate epimerase
VRKIIKFTKMSGAGNDFVLVDNMDGALAVDNAKLAVALCSRHFGVGGDGLLLLEPSTRADFFMRYFNADGSYGGMCGNGGRCIARYAFVHGIALATLTFEALDHVYAAEVADMKVKLYMKEPNSFRLNLTIPVAGGDYKGEFVDTGSPHFVVESIDLNLVNVEVTGKAIRLHAYFQPDGCNVNFVRYEEDGSMTIRTYERGVEAETLACGTGCVASAVIGARTHGLVSPVTLNVRSGEHLRVYFERQGSEFRNTILEGSAHFLFSGKLTYDPDENRIVDFPSAIDQSDFAT